MFKSKDERVERVEERAVERTPQALLNLRSRRTALIIALAAPKAGNVQSLRDETTELFFVDRAIESLS